MLLGWVPLISPLSWLPLSLGSTCATQAPFRGQGLCPGTALVTAEFGPPLPALQATLPRTWAVWNEGGHAGLPLLCPSLPLGQRSCPGGGAPAGTSGSKGPV